jgi:saccharopine dehydrogenase-like NADP-dependent oxidoreductase
MMEESRRLKDSLNNTPDIDLPIRQLQLEYSLSPLRAAIRRTYVVVMLAIASLGFSVVVACILAIVNYPTISDHTARNIRVGMSWDGFARSSM